MGRKKYKDRQFIDGTKTGRMTGGGPGAGPTMPKVQVRDDRAKKGGHIGMMVGGDGAILDIDGNAASYHLDFETPSTLGLYPHQRDALRMIMTTQPLSALPERAGKSYSGFVDYYARHPRRYPGKMRDYLRQSKNSFILGSGEGNRQLEAYRHAFGANLFVATGDADPLKSVAGRRFYAVGEDRNRFDDVFDRRGRREREKLFAYCTEDVIWFGDFAAVEFRTILWMLNGYAPAGPALKGPYGEGAGTGISIRYGYGDVFAPEWPDRDEALMIAGMMIGWGCHLSTARKIADAMFGSGRYDCRVTLSQKAIDNLRNAAEALQCTVRLADQTPTFRPESKADIR